jgi:hypothetical protein
LSIAHGRLGLSEGKGRVASSSQARCQVQSLRYSHIQIRDWLWIVVQPRGRG